MRGRVMGAGCVGERRRMVVGLEGGCEANSSDSARLYTLSRQGHVKRVRNTPRLAARRFLFLGSVSGDIGTAFFWTLYAYIWRSAAATNRHARRAPATTACRCRLSIEVFVVAAVVFVVDNARHRHQQRAQAVVTATRWRI